MLRGERERLQNEIVEAVRGFTEEIEGCLRDHSTLREQAATKAFRFAGRAEALLEWLDREDAEEGA